MRIPLSKALIVVFGLLSVTTSASLYTKPVTHAEDRVKVGTARVELGYRCEMHNECQSSCCSKNRCSDIKACKKSRGMLNSLMDVSIAGNKNTHLNEFDPSCSSTSLI